VTKKSTDIDSLTYEQAREELIGIVASLEAGTATLDDSLGLWERGEALAVRCQFLLEGARERIAQVRGVELGDPADAGVVAVVQDEETAE